METLDIVGNNEEIIKSLMKNREVRAVRIRRKLSKKMLYLILKFTKTERIYITPGILKQLPKGTKEALEKIGVEVIIEKKRGRPTKYNLKELNRALREYGAKEVAKRFNIPLRTVYYYKSQLKAKS